MYILCARVYGATLTILLDHIHIYIYICIYVCICLRILTADVCMSLRYIDIVSQHHIVTPSTASVTIMSPTRTHATDKIEG